ncbi:MAG: PspA/IM30 family protein [Anaerolineales bacterium]|nr:PspA/IM30 family protein [Anaerolineales bacterium]
MASIFQKLRTLIRANLHDLADRALQKDDISVYDEYIRQAEREVEEFKETLIPMRAMVQQTKRRRENLANQAARMDLAIDQFLKKGKQTEAKVTLKQFQSAMSLIQTYDETLRRQINGLEKMEDVRIKLEGRLAIAKQEREELAHLLQMAKAREVSTKALRSLDDLMGQGDSDVARAAENIRSRLDHADAAWEVQTSSLDNQLDEAMVDLEVDAELAERMARLGLE